MRLITLNTWANRVHDPLIDFVKREASQTDVFCFQEVYHTTSDRVHTTDSQHERADGLQQLQNALGSDFNSYYATVQSGVHGEGRANFHLEYGNATFIKKVHTVIDEQSVFVYRSAEDTALIPALGKPRRPIATKLKSADGKVYVVINFHGLWQAGTDKKDIPDRLEQSRRLREVMDSYSEPIILAGDFNLLPDGVSMRMLEEGMKNLVTEYGVTSTRSSFYEKPIRLADYILVSPEIPVIKFEVLQDEVSDHLPLMLEWA